MGILSADHVRVFLAVVEHGSFSAAARALRRNQSAVSYAISNLESQLGVELFDRSGARPILTSAGAALLPDARKATYSLDVMRERGKAFSRGTETELVIAVDTFCPVDFLAEALAEFTVEFPAVRSQIHLELLHQTLKLILDRNCTFGIIGHPMGSREELDQFPLGFKVDVRPYVASTHILARRGCRLENEDLDSHIQFILADRDGLSAGQELGIFTRRTWASSDIRALHALIRAGIGWGFLPAHIAERDVEVGRLVPLDLAVWPDGGAANVTMMVVHHSDAALGPAATWLLRRLIGAPQG